METPYWCTVLVHQYGRQKSTKHLEFTFSLCSGRGARAGVGGNSKYQVTGMINFDFGIFFGRKILASIFMGSLI